DTPWNGYDKSPASNSCGKRTATGAPALRTAGIESSPPSPSSLNPNSQEVYHESYPARAHRVSAARVLRQPDPDPIEAACGVLQESGRATPATTRSGQGLGSRGVTQGAGGERPSRGVGSPGAAGARHVRDLPRGNRDLQRNLLVVQGESKKPQ